MSTATDAHKVFRIEVEGMTCGHCEQRVHDAAMASSGVVSAQASHESNALVVEVVADEFAMGDLIKAVASAGFSPGDVEEVPDVEGALQTGQRVRRRLPGGSGCRSQR